MHRKISEVCLDALEDFAGFDDWWHDLEDDIKNDVREELSSRLELTINLLTEESDTDNNKVMEERDFWEAKATELAEDIGKYLGFDVGEHSSANCPVQSAIDGLYEMGSQIEEWISK